MLRIVFMGTAPFAVPALTEIAGQGHDVAAVYTRAPKPAGRGLGERRSAVHEAAGRLGLPVLTPRTLRDPETLAELAAFDADVAVVVAYGLILPPEALAAPREGCLNLHASLLPRWRGAAPIARAIMAGDAETGVAVMRMEEGLDTGPVAMVERVPIPLEATAGALTGRLARLGADLMVRALAGLSRGGLDFRPQPAEGVTYAAKIDKAETRIAWDRPALRVHDHIRGLSPFPGAWTEIAIAGRPERVKVLRSEPEEGSGPPGTVLDAGLRIACAAGAVRLVELQRAGGRPMAADSFLRGAAVPAGTVIA